MGSAKLPLATSSCGRAIEQRSVRHRVPMHATRDPAFGRNVDFRLPTPKWSAMMAVDLPEGFDDELVSCLERDLGGNWPDVFVQKWGDDWAGPCAADLERQFGSGWPNESTDSKITALVALVGTTATANVDSDEATFPDPAQDAWMQTFAEVNTFEEWLVRIGAPADEVAALVNLAKSEGTLPDPAQSE